MTAPENDHKVYEVLLELPNKQRVIRVGEDEHIWDAAAAAGISLPALCHQGYCLTCAARLENGGIVDPSDSLVYFPEDRQAGFILPCTAKPRSDLKVRTHQQDEMRKFRRERGLPAPYWNT
jgi:ferredoxin